MGISSEWITTGGGKVKACSQTVGSEASNMKPRNTN